MQTLSQRNGRHVSSAQAGGALQNPAYRLADIFKNEGSGATRRTPRQFIPYFIGFLEFGVYSGTYNPFRTDPARAFTIKHEATGL